MTDLVIVGGGIAGLTAALYALRAGKCVTVLEKEAFGGQIAAAARVDNYPGLPGISGIKLADAMLGQAMDAGAEIELERAEGLTAIPNGFALKAGDHTLAARAVILATGVRHRTLGLPDEARLTGHGVSYCAVCDGAFFRGEDVAVVGGGSSAAQAALFLSGLSRSVTLVHRRGGFRCAGRELDALRARENVRLRLNARVTALRGSDKLRGVTVTDTDGAVGDLDVTGLFVCIGQEPDNAAFASAVALDADGFIPTDARRQTSLPGVFAAGDCRVKTVRQLTTAAADGTIAALSACTYLDGGTARA